MTKPKEIMKLAESDLQGENLVSVKLCRKNGETLLYVQADEKIENLLQTGEMAESSSWKDPETGENYKFFKKSGYDGNLKDTMRNYNDDYGHKAFNGNGNVAYLRTKGISDGKFFEIQKPLTEKNLKRIVIDIKECVDELKDKFLKDAAFIGEIREIEVEKTVQTSFTED